MADNVLIKCPNCGKTAKIPCSIQWWKLDVYTCMQCGKTFDPRSNRAGVNRGKVQLDPPLTQTESQVSSALSLQEENERLRRENERLSAENNVLMQLLSRKEG